MYSPPKAKSPIERQKRSPGGQQVQFQDVGNLAEEREEFYRNDVGLLRQGNVVESVSYKVFCSFIELYCKE